MVGSIEEFQIRHMARMAGSGSMGMARRIRSMLSSDFEASHAVSRRGVKKKCLGNPRRVTFWKQEEKKILLFMSRHLRTQC